MDDVVISVNNLSKEYKIGAVQDRTDMFRDWLVNKIRRSSHDGRDESLWALKDVSFDVKRGEVVGIIGRNGAGKSTLLKILSRITEPTSGRVEMDGRVGSLLEVGTGFHPELTGRENVFLSGAILGMRRAEINRRFDEIVAFSGIEKFIDTPFKRYSSGMQVRLGFAVAAHLEPEILLIDEVLAVGDLAFQKKCLGKMSEVAQEGRTVVFVSHNLAAVASLCSFSYLLESGRVTYQGESSTVVKQYLNGVSGHNYQENSFEVNRSVLDSQRASGLRGVSVTDVQLLRDGSDSNNKIHTGDSLTFRIQYRIEQKIISPAISVSFFNQLGTEIVRLNTMPMSGLFIDTLLGHGYIDLTIESIPFTGGRYHLNIVFFQPRIETILRLDNVASFKITPTDVYGSGYPLHQNQGVIALSHRWHITKISG